jgi:hypothetical protein
MFPIICQAINSPSAVEGFLQAFHVIQFGFNHFDSFGGKFLGGCRILMPCETAHGELPILEEKSNNGTTLNAYNELPPETEPPVAPDTAIRRLLPVMLAGCCRGGNSA